MRGRLHTTLPGGVLPLVLSVSVVVGIICLAMVLLGYVNRVLYVTNDATSRLHRNVQSGYNYILADANQVTAPLSGVEDLFGRGTDSVLIGRKRWGLYEVGTVLAWAGNQQKGGAIMIGHRPDSLGQAALYLADERRPLSIAGNTRISGKAYLPRAGIRTAYINRTGYSGSKLVYGTTRYSNSSMPQLDAEAAEAIFAIYNGNNTPTYRLDARPAGTDSIGRSFLRDSAQYLQLEGGMAISGAINGQVIVHSPGKLHLPAKAQINHAIIIARHVTVANGFEGTLQIFATDSIVLGQRVQLGYPSALVCQGQQGGYISIGQNSQVTGTILHLGQASNERYNQCKLLPGSVLTGRAYINGFAEVQGTIKGHLSCRKFLLQTPATLYENHLFNATIDSERIASQYLGTPVWGSASTRGIISTLP